MKSKIYVIVVSILTLVCNISIAQNVVADLFLLNSTTLRFNVRFNNNLQLNVTNTPVLNVNGTNYSGIFSPSYSMYTVDFPFIVDSVYEIISTNQSDAGNSYSDIAYFKLLVDTSGRIHFGNFNDTTETTFDPFLSGLEIANEQQVVLPVLNASIYSGTITNVSDITDPLQMLMSSNGIVKIQFTDGSLVTATTSGYNNSLNTINFSANIPGGKTVARVLASHAWIDVPDVMSVFALPIDIISFEGKSIENEYHLALKVAKEWNVKQLELEKSIEGKTYETIETLLPENSSIYNFIDRNPSQINFYRIKVVDIDEHIMYSKVLNYSKTNIDKVKLYPNPTTNILTIELPKWKTYQTIYIKNLFGQIVYKKEILDKKYETINTESLSGGNYILQVVSTSQTLTTKFSKE